MSSTFLDNQVHLQPHLAEFVEVVLISGNFSASMSISDVSFLHLGGTIGTIWGPKELYM